MERERDAFRAFGYLKRKIQREAQGASLFGAFEVVHSCSQNKSFFLWTSASNSRPREELFGKTIRLPCSNSACFSWHIKCISDLICLYSSILNKKSTPTGSASISHLSLTIKSLHHAFHWPRQSDWGSEMSSVTEWRATNVHRPRCES